MVLVPNDPGGEPVAEQVARPIPPLVERLRVDAVQPLHAGGERSQLRFDHGVVVRAECAPRVQRPAAPTRRVVELAPPAVAVEGIPEGEHLAGAACGDVIDA